jgi:hypothetical protein
MRTFLPTRKRPLGTPSGHGCVGVGAALAFFERFDEDLAVGVLLALPEAGAGALRLVVGVTVSAAFVTARAPVDCLLPVSAPALPESRLSRLLGFSPPLAGTGGLLAELLTLA